MSMKNFNISKKNYKKISKSISSLYKGKMSIPEINSEIYNCAADLISEGKTPSIKNITNHIKYRFLLLYKEKKQPCVKLTHDYYSFDEHQFMHTISGLLSDHDIKNCTDFMSNKITYSEFLDRYNNLEYKANEVLDIVDNAYDRLFQSSLQK